MNLKKDLFFIFDGFAYVLKCDIFWLICIKYRIILENQLESSLKSLLRMIVESERLFPILKNLNSFEFYTNDHTNGNMDGHSLFASDIEGVYKHFLPYMQKIHSKLRAESHLKYGGRMHYGLL